MLCHYRPFFITPITLIILIIPIDYCPLNFMSL